MLIRVSPSAPGFKILDAMGELKRTFISIPHSGTRSWMRPVLRRLHHVMRSGSSRSLTVVGARSRSGVIFGESFGLANEGAFQDHASFLVALRLFGGELVNPTQ